MREISAGTGAAMAARSAAAGGSLEMKPRILGSAFAIILALTATTGAFADAAFAPDGTYEYALRQGATTVATSTVTIKRSGSVISLRESQTIAEPAIGNVQLNADESVLADSFTPLSFGGTTVSSGKSQEVKFAFANNAGYFSVNGERLVVPVRMLPGTQAMIIQDQTLVLSFLTLPAVLQATRAGAITVAVPTASRVHAITVDSSLQTKPSTVPAADAAVAIAADNGSTAFSVWYDPHNGVIDEIDVPSQSLTISLTKRS
jgi:hypothetical protein